VWTAIHRFNVMCFRRACQDGPSLISLAQRAWSSAGMTFLPQATNICFGDCQMRHVRSSINDSAWYKEKNESRDRTF